MLKLGFSESSLNILNLLFPKNSLSLGVKGLINKVTTVNYITNLADYTFLIT